MLLTQSVNKKGHGLAPAVCWFDKHSPVCRLVTPFPYLARPLGTKRVLLILGLLSLLSPTRFGVSVKPWRVHLETTFQLCLNPSRFSCEPVRCVLERNIVLLWPAFSAVKSTLGAMESFQLASDVRTTRESASMPNHAEESEIQANGGR